jgi:Chromo (CHRromatin Organisation MOdifier) domain
MAAKGNQKTFPKEYTIEKIMDSKKENNTTYYLVKWEGYSMKDCTWEPRKHFTNSEHVIEEFEKTQSLPSKTTTTSLSARSTSDRLSSSVSSTKQLCEKRQSKTKKSLGKSKKVKTEKARGILGVDDAESIANYHLGKDNKLEFEIKWRPNCNGERPRTTTASSADVKLYYPRILCEFYESKLRFEDP